MFYRTVKAEAKELLSAAGQWIRKAGKTPAGNAGLVGCVLLEVGAMQTAVFFLRATVLLLHGTGALVGRISREDRPGPLLLEDHRRSRTFSERIREAWMFRAEIMRENRGCVGI